MRAAAHAPGPVFLPGEPKKGEERGGEGPGQPSGQIVQEERHEPVNRHGGPGQAAAAQLQAQAVEAEGQENEQQAGQDPGNRYGVGHPGSQPIKALDSPGHIVAGICRQEISLKERRVQPLLHPEDLLADVVVDHIRRGQGLEVGQDENDVGEDARHQQVENGGVRRGPRILHGSKLSFKYPEGLVLLAPEGLDHLDPVASDFRESGRNRQNYKGCV